MAARGGARHGTARQGKVHGMGLLIKI